MPPDPILPYVTTCPRCSRRCIHRVGLVPVRNRGLFAIFQCEFCVDSCYIGPGEPILSSFIFALDHAGRHYHADTFQPITPQSPPKTIP